MQVICDRGLRNREVLQKYMDERNIPVFHTPLEPPEGIGRVERHGGLLKGMYRKICHEIQIQGREQVETALSQACMVKNEQNRVGGFSPSQWVLGKGPWEAPSIVSEEQWAQLGAIEAKYDSTSIFALQHQARMEAQKAFVHLDCSRRVRKALLRNASTIKRTYSVGDSVVFRRDNQRGGRQWSPPARVIGQEGLWLLCGNVPVLVAAQNVRPATASEALALSILHGDPIVPGEIV